MKIKPYHNISQPQVWSPDIAMVSVIVSVRTQLVKPENYQSEVLTLVFSCESNS